MFKVYLCLYPDEVETLKTLQEKHGVKVDKHLLKNLVYAIHAECYPSSKPIPKYYSDMAELFFGEELYSVIYRLGPDIKDVEVSDNGVIKIWLS